MYSLRSLNAIHSRHFDIKQDNIGPKFCELFQGLFAIFSFTTDMDR